MRCIFKKNNNKEKIGRLPYLRLFCLGRISARVPHLCDVFTSTEKGVKTIQALGGTCLRAIMTCISDLCRTFPLACIEILILIYLFLFSSSLNRFRDFGFDSDLVNLGS